MGDERTGLQTIKRALEAPARQIAENSAFDGGVVVDRMRNGTGNFGFDAARKQASWTRRKSYDSLWRMPCRSQAYCC